MVENSAGAVEVGEEFFFGAEFGGMRDQAAAGTAGRMFDVEHLMVEDVFDGDLRNGRMIHSAIQENLVRAGVVAAELASPASRAPADVGALQGASEIRFVYFLKNFL